MDKKNYLLDQALFNEDKYGQVEGSWFATSIYSKLRDYIYSYTIEKDNISINNYQYCNIF